ncbi:MAG TPA: type II toxin-antitoxin system prevent-host-death family antitoxin [Polyangia bacterium]|nr:type II toxin-antitoxin system prevent-host-death family antitoxin [Polyangia bacterium]
MKVVALQAAKQSLSGIVHEAQRERIVITRHGKPVVMMIGIEGEDLEKVLVALAALAKRKGGR